MILLYKVDIDRYSEQILIFGKINVVEVGGKWYVVGQVILLHDSARIIWRQFEVHPDHAELFIRIVHHNRDKQTSEYRRLHGYKLFLK